MGEGAGGGENNAEFFREGHRRSLKGKKMDTIHCRILYWRTD